LGSCSGVAHAPPLEPELVPPLEELAWPAEPPEEELELVLDAPDDDDDDVLDAFVDD
jgi:hypothetical protein